MKKNQQYFFSSFVVRLLLILVGFISITSSVSSFPLAQSNPPRSLQSFGGIGPWRTTVSPPTSSVANAHTSLCMVNKKDFIMSKQAIVTPRVAQAAIVGIKQSVSFLVSIGTLIAREIRGLSDSQRIFMIGVFLAGFLIGKMPVFWKRYESTMDIPSSLFGTNARVLKGRAISITDGDTIRFLHTPTPWSPKRLLETQKKNGKKTKQKLSEIALPIRICTIDAPEIAKFGNPGQPFGVEAKAHLSELLQSNPVYIRMLQKDQYGRAVADVFVKKRRLPFVGRTRIHVDEYMLQAGFAEVYQGAGAVYGTLGKDAYLELEATARKQKLGIWSKRNRESASDYKRRTKS